MLDVLQPIQGETYLDLTAGYGGHAGAVLDKLGNEKLLTLVDRDVEAIKALESYSKRGARVIQKDYLSAAEELRSEALAFDMVLLDIGVSSPHLDKPERGFSFQNEGPLDMRMDQNSGVTAAEFIDRSSLEQLTQVLYEFGEERQAKRIAKLMVENRPFSTTTQLAGLIEETLGRRGKIHPATRTFQALRIAVNDELAQIEQVLPIVLDILKPGGRVAVITFHSLEDRIVKRFFKHESEGGYEARLKLITKKPISGAINDAFNRRARSAKLRAAIKINT